MVAALLSLTLLAASGEGKMAFDAWEAKLAATKSLSGTLKIDAGPDSETIGFRLMKPNRGQVQTKTTQRYADGRWLFNYKPSSNAYTKRETLSLPFVSEFFFGFEAFGGEDSNFKFEAETTAKFQDADVYAVVLNQLPGRVTGLGQKGVYGPGLHLTLYFDMQSRASFSISPSSPSRGPTKTSPSIRR